MLCPLKINFDRPSWTADVNRCHDREPQCNCIQIQKKWWGGNVGLLSLSYRYNYDIDLLEHERVDPSQFQLVAWGMLPSERVLITMRFIQWKVADDYGRPLYWMRVRDTPAGGGYYMADAFGATSWSDVSAMNYEATSKCDGTTGYCGKVEQVADWQHQDLDQLGTYQAGDGSAGNVPVPAPDADVFSYTVKEDASGDAALVTMLLVNGGLAQKHVAAEIYVNTCPADGCWPAPPPPKPKEKVKLFFQKWSSAETWSNTTNHPNNPLNSLVKDEAASAATGKTIFKVGEVQEWPAKVPSDYDNVWIPEWSKVILDVSSPILGRLIIEGTLIINSSSTVDLTATFIEVKGGKLLVAAFDSFGNITGPYNHGKVNIKLLGTNSQLSGEFGSDPRLTPRVPLGQEGLELGSSTLGVFGTFLALGRKTSDSYVALSSTAEAGVSSIHVAGTIDWSPGDEIVITPTDFDAHEAEVLTISEVNHLGSTSIITTAQPLANRHHAGPVVTDGGNSLQMRARVGLLSRNIVIRGAGQGEEQPYHLWNIPSELGPSATAACGNGLCEVGENSENCGLDCIGPAYEYGASIIVSQ